jgi:hypothetical protein
MEEKKIGKKKLFFLSSEKKVSLIVNKKIKTFLCALI